MKTSPLKVGDLNMGNLRPLWRSILFGGYFWALMACGGLFFICVFISSPYRLTLKDQFLVLLTFCWVYICLIQWDYLFTIFKLKKMKPAEMIMSLKENGVVFYNKSSPARRVYYTIELISLNSVEARKNKFVLCNSSRPEVVYFRERILNQKCWVFGAMDKGHLLILTREGRWLWTSKPAE